MATSPTPGAAAGEIALIDGFQAMSRAIVAVTTRCLAQMAEDATLAQYRAMVVLVSRGPQRISDLATELNVTASTASRLCDRLARKGLIVRSRCDTDRRVVRVDLTKGGADFIGEAMRRRREAIQQLLHGMAAEVAIEAAETLNAFAAAAGEPTEAEWWMRWRSLTTPDGSVDAWSAADGRAAAEP